MENITLGQIIVALGIIGTIGGALVTVFNFAFKYKFKFIEIDRRLENLEKDSKRNDTENKILLKGLLACLKGLKEQGCNGPVTQSIAEIEEYLITK